MNKIDWLENIVIAVVVSALVAAGFFFIAGEHVGWPTYIFWALCSIVVNTIMDLVRANR